MTDFSKEALSSDDKERLKFLNLMDITFGIIPHGKKNCIYNLEEIMLWLLLDTRDFSKKFKPDLFKKLSTLKQSKKDVQGKLWLEVELMLRHHKYVTTDTVLLFLQDECLSVPKELQAETTTYYPFIETRHRKEFQKCETAQQLNFKRAFCAVYCLVCKSKKD